MKRCDGCRFWIKVGKEDVNGDCRRHTPTPHMIQAMNPLSREMGIIVNAYFFKMRPELWCGDYRRRPRLIPFFRRLIGRVIGFLIRVKGHHISNSDGGEECLSKEESKNMPVAEKPGSMPTAACLKRKSSQN